MLSSARALIVLLKKKAHNQALSPAIAPNNPYLGVMLPYTPLHLLICLAINKPLLVTSANRSGEPVCCDNQQALTQLNLLVDRFLLHDRQIYQGLDDSIVKFVNQQPMLLRRARGYVPETFPLDNESPVIMALGGQLKNTIALTKGKRLYLSQYIGDLENVAAIDRHQKTKTIMQTLLAHQAEMVACDLHPNYVTSQLAKDTGLTVCSVQHHIAHLYAAMFEHQIKSDAFGAVWDGNGYGDDGRLWGGEFFSVVDETVKRVATFLPFQLPGGSAAIKEPQRVAFALLYQIYGEQLSTDKSIASLLPLDLVTIKQFIKLLENNINSPFTSSAGRLFDGVASLLGLAQCNSFEGEAAMALEFAAICATDTSVYKMPVDFSVTPNIIDWRPMIRAIITDMTKQVDAAVIARRFHNSAAAIIAKIAQHYSAKQLLLTGGCFQNLLLIELTAEQAKKQGIEPLWQQKLPANDASLAVGQSRAAYRQSLLGKK